MEVLRKEIQYLDLIINSIVVKEELLKFEEWSEELLRKVADSLSEN